MTTEDREIHTALSIAQGDAAYTRRVYEATRDRWQSECLRDNLDPENERGYYQIDELKSRADEALARATRLMTIAIESDETASIQTTDGIVLAVAHTPVYYKLKNRERALAARAQFPANVRVMAAAQAMLETLKSIGEGSIDARTFKHIQGVIAQAEPPLFNVTCKRQISDGDPMLMFSGTSDECFAYILRHQGQSVDYATKHGGWAIVPA